MQSLLRVEFVATLVAALNRRQQRFKRLFPRRYPKGDFVLIQPVKDIAAKTEPRGVWVVQLHQVPPNPRWKPISSLAIKRDLCDLKPSVVAFIKHRTAEEEDQRNLTVFEPREIFCSRDVEIERTRHREIDLSAAFEGAD